MQNRPALRLTQPEWVTALTPERLVVGLLFILIWALAALMHPQSDTWWQLRAGQDFWRDGAVPLIDRYSHTVNGGFWMNHEWLTHAVFYGVYSIGGLPLLTAMAATVCTAALVVTWSLMTGPTVMRLGLIALSILTFSRGWSPRPYIFTLLLVGLTVKLLMTNRSWWLPVLFVIWANLHGGFTMGIALVGASVIAAVPDGRAAVQRRLVLLGCCLIATLITPLGWTFYTELPASLARLQAYQISEWQSPALGNPSLHAFWLVIPILVIATVRRWREILAKPDDRLVVVAALVFLPFALTYVRSVTPFMLLALPALTRAFPLALPERTAEAPARARVYAGILGTAALASLTVVGAAWATPWQSLQWEPLPRAAMGAIADCDGRLYNSYNDGGYLVWFMPERQVFLDSRQDPYPVDLVIRDINARHHGEYTETFERYQIRCALVRPDDHVLAERLEDDGWLARYRDDAWIVFEANDGRG